MHPPIPLPEMRRRAENAMIVAGLGALAALPMFAGQFQRLGPLLFERPPDAAAAWQLATGQTVIVFCLLLLCALVGLLYAERLHLPGLGSTRRLGHWLGFSSLAGLVVAPFAYWLLDSGVMTYLPELYPHTAGGALIDMLGTALVQEVIVRCGLLTITLYFVRRFGCQGYPWPAITLVAGFAAFGLYQFMLKFDTAVHLPASSLITGVVVSFALQWLYCEVYLRYGLLAGICVHFGLSIKFLLYTILL